VTRLEFSGDTVFHREYSYSPQSYDEAALDTIAARSLTGLGGIVAMVDGVALRPEAPGDPEAARGVIRSRMSFPAFQPPIQAQFAGADGSLWLRREEQGEATYDWLIIDPAGDLQGVVRIPRRVRPAWAGGDEAWLIEFDEFDVPWMVKYRIGAR
jgi:hypothetical protein